MNQANFIKTHETTINKIKNDLRKKLSLCLNNLTYAFC